MIEAATPTTPKAQFLARFDLPAHEHGSTWQNLREKALDVLENNEFPTTRDEYWKYTRVGSVLRKAYNEGVSASATVNPADFAIEGFDPIELIFVNGRFQAEQSTIIESDKIIVVPMSVAMVKYRELVDQHLGTLVDQETQMFTALNTAYSNEGLFVYLKPGAILERTVRMLHLNSGDRVAYHPRHLMVFGANSQAQVINAHVNHQGEENFINSVTEIVVGDNAQIDYLISEREGESDQHIDTTEVHQGRDSRFTIHTLTFRGKLIRNNLNIKVNGEGAETNLYGVYLTTGKQHVDNHTLVDHRVPNCNSNELYKGIMNEKSTAVFNGKVFVRQIAQKTNAFQSNQNILLTDDATINSKPELEIYADDVKCSHGSTTGQFDEEALFYLRSRGIGESSARKLLIKAFAAEVVESLQMTSIREVVEQFISDRYDSVLE